MSEVDGMGNIEHSEREPIFRWKALGSHDVEPEEVTDHYVPTGEVESLRQQLQGAVEALKLIACARAQSGQHAIDVGLARNALEAMGVDPSLWRGQ